jgi:uncharacterized protein YdeI (YjbR/CyaY-like superfamily)
LADREPVFFDSPAAFRRWLEAHSATETELWAGYYKRATGRPSMTWPESVDQALCYGWIDGLRRSLGEDAYTIRFTPRKRGSNWSAVNIARVGELAALGLMMPAGLAAFAARDDERSRVYSYEREKAALEPEQEGRLRADPDAWRFWEAQQPSYRRVAAWWVVSAKRPETRERRLQQLIAESAAGRRIAAAVPSRGD